MCCFSGHVQRVSATKIFARKPSPGAQVLVYEMVLSASEDLAMVLPLPVTLGAAEDAVRFIDLEGYPDFFADVDRAFPAEPVPRAPSGAIAGFGPPQTPLVVHDVGAFVASFVPTLGDFSRLDPRFTLPASTWEKLPAYRDYGFAVFKLKGFSGEAIETPAPKPGFFGQWFGGAGSSPQSSGAQAAKKVHPMAFSFPTRSSSEIFFPTVHIHDGKVRDVAAFDHALYFQVDLSHPGPFLGWEASPRTASFHVDHHRAEQTIDPTARLYRRFFKGELPNRDTWVKTGEVA